MRYLVLPVLLLLCSCVTVPRSDSTVIARIGSQPVTAAQLEGRILDRYHGSRALLGLIQEELFRQEAARLGIRISEDELRERMEQELARLFGPSGAERDARLAPLAERGLELDDVRRELRAELTNSMLLQRVVQARREITDAQVAELYRNTFEQPRVRMRHIAFPFDEGCADDPQHVALVRTQAARVAEELDRGADFATLARAHSGNRRTAAQGGEIGWVNAEIMKDARFSQAVFELPVGAISEPLREAAYGFHVVRVEDRIEARPLEEVRVHLVEHLRTQPATTIEIQGLENELRSHIPVVVHKEALSRSVEGALATLPAPTRTHRAAPTAAARPSPDLTGTPTPSAARLAPVVDTTQAPSQRPWADDDFVIPPAPIPVGAGHRAPSSPVDPAAER